MFLTISAPEREPVTERVKGPGGVVRIAVGRHDRRGSIWRIWANKKTADVYVAARTVAGVQKYSLHASGDWRQQWTTREHAMTFGGTEDRVLDQWRRPPADDVGWIPGMSILTPHGNLQDLPDEPANEDVIWLPEPDEGEVAGIHVAIAQPDGGEFPSVGLCPVKAFSLATGGAVVVLWSGRMLTQGEVEWLETARAEALEHLRASAGRDGDLSAEGRRLGLHSSDENGHRKVWDLVMPSDT